MAERASIAAWLEKHRDNIVRWVSWNTHKLDRSEREDVAQQVSLELLNRDDEVHNPEALAKQIASFRAIDAIRNKQNAPQSIEECEDDAEIGTASHNGHPPSTITEQDIDVVPAGDHQHSTLLRSSHGRMCKHLCSRPGNRTR